VTEEEARNKWCPFARVHTPDRTGSTAANRDFDGLRRGSQCIASDCMMWRKDSQSTGYCGLAGRPLV
jgi:hypothetical protein